VGLARVRLRSDLRAGYRRWAGAIVVLALAAAAALTAATAARRTDTAFARALTAAHTADAYVSVNALGTGPEAARVLGRLEHASVVAASGRFGGATLAVVRAGRIDRRFNTGTATAYLPYDTRVGVTISTFRVLHGRAASPGASDEVVVNDEYANVMHARVGTTLAGLRMFGLRDVDEDGNPDPRKGTPVSLRIVGVVKTPDEELTPAPLRIFTTPAFTRRFPTAPYYYQELLVLKRGTSDLRSLTAEVDRLQKANPDSPLFVSPLHEGLVKATRAADPLVNGLWILAGLALVVGLLLAGQAFARVLSTGAGDNAVYRTLGVTRLQRLRAELGTVAPALVIAAVVAVAVAWALSPLTPVGAARAAEPHPGFALHTGFALAIVATIIVGGVLAVLPAAFRAAFSTALPGQPATPERARPSRAAQAVADAGMGLPAVVGTQLAFEPGRGSTATPVAGVLATLALIVATVTGTVAFGTNLNRLVTTKSLYGWNWDAAVGTSFGTIPKAAQPEVLRAPGVHAMAGLTLGRLTIGKLVVPAVGIDPLVGTVAPTLDAGRLPVENDEIALGAKTLRVAHAHIGDTIDASIDGRRVSLRVVGIATFPAFGASSFSQAGLGTGAVGRAALWPQHDPQSDGAYNYFLLRYRPPGPTRAETKSLHDLLERLGCTDSTCVLDDLRPIEIDGFRNARSVPLVVGIVLALLLVATLAHALTSTMRRRRGDLAVLRELGCTRRQLESIMRWQTFMLSASALVVGIPLGLVANRLVWRAFTDRFGIAPGTVLPILVIGVGAAAILVAGWVLATVAGRRAPSYARGRTFTP
jgi:hypothetical protein